MVGADQLPGRLARNESLMHTGNTVFAVFAALMGSFVAPQGIFYAAAVFALEWLRLPTLFVMSMLVMREQEPARR
jgi:hypothetical protein